MYECPSVNTTVLHHRKLIEELLPKNSEPRKKRPASTAEKKKLKSNGLVQQLGLAALQVKSQVRNSIEYTKKRTTSNTEETGHKIRVSRKVGKRVVLPPQMKGGKNKKE